MDRWASRPIVCGIVACCGLLTTRSARAEDPEVKQDKLQEASKEVAPEDRARLDLGLGLMEGWGSGSGGASGFGFGGLIPSIHATGELHLAGPVWLVLRARGGYASWLVDGVESVSWDVGGAVGPLVEAPVFDFADVGGYAVVGGSYGRSTDGPVESGNAQIAGEAGVSVHFRATHFFGVRLLLDVLRVGRTWSGFDSPTLDTRSSGTYAQVTAQPSVELTFTF